MFSRVLNLLIQVYGHVFSRIKVSTESREFTFGKTFGKTLVRLNQLKHVIPRVLNQSL